ncbi:pyridoxal phosphate-dependent aminotransferase [Streptomyces sp. WI03-4A]|uniref:pyridoxal phosphate-dependent aminotransferase n=1 Tax=Streptomyces sp. WI03-4A TaxID=3028706 RepID=UPI0029BCE22C|nr:pyridoxal phosphate-dependent aminotransferase [Streptomyces sp. WI03-4A]MDX2590846.1 pyridoxal phosphate-dependent aminotransferase [Streptomyces sp. WI03-4A]
MTARAAARFHAIEESATYAVFDMVARMRAQGLEVVDLGGGEPDFDTAGHVVDEAVGALRDGFTHYTPSRGLPALLRAVSAKLAEDNGVVADAATDIVVTPSAKHALFAALVTVLDPGDELLVPTPSWVSYTEMARLIGARPVQVALDGADGFRITAELLERHVSPRTKALLVNSPNNPTGRSLTAEEAAVIARFAQEHDVLLISDEIYEKILYDGRAHLSLAAQPGCADRTITVNGFSKGYAMTGWRLGYAAGPTDLMAQLLKVQQHTVGCTASFVQRGGIAALTGSQEPVEWMGAQYAARRDLVVQGLNSLPGVSCSPPDGAFYAFADIRGTGFADSASFAQWLLREAAVAVMPGSAFGAGGEGFVRLSFATSPQVLRTALDRMARALAARS